MKQKIYRKGRAVKAALIALVFLSPLFLCGFISASQMICQQIAAASKEEANHLANKYAREYVRADGEYSVSVDISGGSGKASVTSPTLLTVEGGMTYARIQWSSPNYDYMVVDGDTYYNQSEEGVNSVFEIPVLCWDEEMDVIADTTAMGNPVEVHYQFLFYEDSVGSKGELPQEAAKRVLCVAFAIIVIGGILNYIVKKKNS